MMITRNIETAQLPATHRRAVEDGQLVIVCAGEHQQAQRKRLTSEMAHERNEHVAKAADEIVVAHTPRQRGCWRHSWRDGKQMDEMRACCDARRDPKPLTCASQQARILGFGAAPA